MIHACNLSAKEAETGSMERTGHTDSPWGGGVGRGIAQGHHGSVVGRAATVCGGITEHFVYTAQCHPSQSRECCSSHLPVEKLSHADWGQFTDWRLPRWGDRQTRPSPLVEATSQPPAHPGLSRTERVSQGGVLLKCSSAFTGYSWPIFLIYAALWIPTASSWLAV